LISGHIKEIDTLEYNIQKTKDANSLQWLKKELKKEKEALESRRDTLKTTETDLLAIDENIKKLEKEEKERTLEKAITDFTSQYEMLCSKNPNRVKILRRRVSDPPKPPEVSWVLSKYDDNDLETARVNLLSTHPPPKISSDRLIKGETYYVLDPNGKYNGKTNGRYTFPVFATYAYDKSKGGFFNKNIAKFFNIYRNGEHIADDPGTRWAPRMGGEPDNFELDTTVLEFYHPRITLPPPSTAAISSAGGNKRKTRSLNKTSKRRVKTKSHRRRRNNISRRRKQRR